MAYHKPMNLYKLQTKQTPTPSDFSIKKSKCTLLKYLTIHSTQGRWHCKYWLHTRSSLNIYITTVQCTLYSKWDPK